MTKALNWFKLLARLGDPPNSDQNNASRWFTLLALVLYSHLIYTQERRDLLGIIAGIMPTTASGSLNWDSKPMIWAVTSLCQKTVGFSFVETWNRNDWNGLVSFLSINVSRKEETYYRISYILSFILYCKLVILYTWKVVLKETRLNWLLELISTVFSHFEISNKKTFYRTRTPPILHSFSYLNNSVRTFGLRFVFECIFD